MATLVDIAKQIESLQGILRSAERTHRFVEEFSRHNGLLARSYDDALRRELARRGWFIAGTLYPRQYVPLAQALKQSREPELEEFLKSHVKKVIADVRKNALVPFPVDGFRACGSGA
jgi:hypothetical protein